jgi:ABC-2 type transport system ATP-binding protein
MELIEIKNLKKIYGKSLVIDIPALEMKEGKIYSIIGNNGAGKTTLLRLILDLLEANNGCVKINGRNVSNNEDWKLITNAYLDSDFLIDFLTVEEFILFICEIYGISKKEMYSRMDVFKFFLGNEYAFKNKYITDFSSGDKQKTGILAAMITHPKILILDEPFNFLDPTSQIEFKKLLSSFLNNNKTTIILSSHNIDHILDVSSKIILMENGSIIKEIENKSEIAKIELINYFNA